MAGSLDISVSLDVVPFARWLESKILRRMKQATAIALNRTAEDAQRVVRDELHKHFTIRSPFIARRIQINPASPSRLFSEVGSRDQFMRTQALGGVKRAKQGTRLAIPVRARLRPRQRTPKTSWPEALLGKRGHFIAELPGGELAVYRRTETGLELLWILVREVKVKPSWPLFETVERVVGEVWARNAVEAFERVLGSG